jgi:hypothetical protein
MGSLNMMEVDEIKHGGEQIPSPIKRVLNLQKL